MAGILLHLMVNVTRNPTVTAHLADMIDIAIIVQGFKSYYVKILRCPITFNLPAWLEIIYIYIQANIYNAIIFIKQAHLLPCFAYEHLFFRFTAKKYTSDDRQK